MFKNAITTAIHDSFGDNPASALMPLHWLRWVAAGPASDPHACLRATLRIGGALHLVTAMAIRLRPDDDPECPDCWEFDVDWPSDVSPGGLFDDGSSDTQAMYRMFDMEGEPSRVTINGREYALFMCPFSG